MIDKLQEERVRAEMGAEERRLGQGEQQLAIGRQAEERAQKESLERIMAERA